MYFVPSVSNGKQSFFWTVHTYSYLPVIHFISSGYLCDGVMPATRDILFCLWRNTLKSIRIRWRSYWFKTYISWTFAQSTAWLGYNKNYTTCTFVCAWIYLLTILHGQYVREGHMEFNKFSFSSATPESIPKLKSQVIRLFTLR